MERFEALFKQLERLASEDAEAHRRSTSLDERVRIHDGLVRVRSEIARVSKEIGLDRMPISGHDSRTRRFTTQ